MGVVLGVDAGNFTGKVAGEHGVESFRTTICEWFEQDIKETFGDDDMEFEIGGRKGFAGSIAEHEDEFDGGMMFGDTKAHEDTKIRILLAVYRYLERYCPGEQNVTIVTGQPIVSHKDVDKKKIIDMVKGYHEIVVNGHRRVIEIDEVGVSAEGSSAYWSIEHDDAEQDAKMRIIDVGSGTVNCATIVKKKHIHSASGTFNYGTETITNKEDLESLARGILRSTTKLKWKNDDTVYVCGGVAAGVLPYLLNHYPNVKLLTPHLVKRGGDVMELEPVYANAVGFYEIARLVYL